MKEDENFAAYFLQVDETMKTIRGLGEEFDELVVVQNFIRSLPIRFDLKISALEEITYNDSLSMEELHGIFIDYEMRIKKENPVMKEETFKESKNTKRKNKKNPKLDCSCSDDSEEDEEVANFFQKLKRGTRKCKGMIPLKCFNCGGIGHFMSKFPHKNKENDEEQDTKQKNKNKNDRGNKKKLFRKSLCTKEDSLSSNED
jgi:DNA-directed RNA polymerase subunit N (RpoN/RPB10)